MGYLYKYYKNRIEQKKHFKKIAKYVIIISIICAFLIAAFNFTLDVTNYKIYSDKITTPFRLVLVTDLHSAYYGKNQQTLVRAIKRENPDVVLYAGDIADDEIPHENTKALLEEIGALYNSFYVTGNHEIWSGEEKEIKAMFESYGVTVLEGDCVPLKIRGEAVYFCGVDDPEIGEDMMYAQLDKCTSRRDKRKFSVLLAHRPEYIHGYLQKDFDLITVGHAHGGLIRLPFMQNGLFAPNQGLFPKYTSGLYTFPNSQMIVSRGLSYNSTALPRFFNRPELAVIDVLPKHP